LMGSPVARADGAVPKPPITVAAISVALATLRIERITYSSTRKRFWPNA
jgi:hypothetical protein